MSKKQMKFHEALAEVNEKFDGWIADDITNTQMTYMEIGAKHGVSHVHVCGIANKRGINRPRGKSSPAYKLSIK